MSGKESSPIRMEQPKQPEYFQDILKFSNRLPVSGKEIKNCRKLFNSGVMSVFADELDSLESDLEIYFTDDFSKICLRESGKREALMSVGIGHDETGAINIRAIVRGNILPPIPKNELGLFTLKGVFQGVVYGREK